MAYASTSSNGQAVHEKVRAFLNKRGARSLKQIAKLFKAYDTQRDQSLSFTEMQHGLREYGMDLTHSEMEKLFDAFDKDSGGGINLSEFITGEYKLHKQRKVPE